jgi:quinoprotein glucose dehydrogenase
VVFAALMTVGLLMAFRSRRSLDRRAGAVLFVMCVVGMTYGMAQRWMQFRKQDAARFLDTETRDAGFGEDHSPQVNAPYELYRHPILDHQGMSCAPQPWGTVTALDLQNGKIVWKHAHGTQTEGKQTGLPSLGGVIVTAGGLVFSAGTREAAIRAYDSATGQELWKGDLPSAAQATPMTYQVGGKQFVVIAAGGIKAWHTNEGDALVAFALN